MTIRKILFVELKAETLNIFTRFELPRLGNILLATILRDMGYETRVRIERKAVLLGKKPDADLVAISTITPTAPASYELADSYRRLGIPVVMGGPHVTFMAEEALQHADFVVRGEGEVALPALIRALENDSPLTEVPGAAWLENGVAHQNETAPPVMDLDSLPFPDFSLVDNFRKRGIGKFVPVQTSRGCPFDCTFCSVTAMFGKPFRYRSVGNIIRELKTRDPKKESIFFYDDNFTGNKKRARALLSAMIEANLGFAWSTQVRADIGRDPELLDLMKRAGCTTVYIGFESVDPSVLAEMKKSQTVDDMRKAISEIHAHGIHIHGMFVFGFDADTERTVKDSVHFAISEKIETAQFLILTPFPGTRFYETISSQNRLIDFNWTHYDAHHVKFKPAGFTPWALQWAQVRAHARFYAPLRVLARLLRGRLAGFIVGVYAHNLNKKWKRSENSYLRGLKSCYLPAGAHQ